jgi:hypothetical protein
MVSITQIGNTVTVEFSGGSKWRLVESDAAELAQHLNTHFSRRFRASIAPAAQVSLPCDVGD